MLDVLITVSPTAPKAFADELSWVYVWRMPSVIYAKAGPKR